MFDESKRRKLMLLAQQLAVAYLDMMETEWEKGPAIYRTAVLVSIRQGISHVDVAVCDGVGAQLRVDTLLGTIEFKRASTLQPKKP